MLREWRQNSSLANQVWRELCVNAGLSDYESDDDWESLSLSPDWWDSSWTAGQGQKIPIEKRRRAALLRGLLITADHMASAHQSLPPILKLSELKMKYPPRPFQSKAGGTLGSAILRAPTGSGKTEAALLWAAHNQTENGRLLYILPYTAAINAMHRRLQESFPSSESSIGVLHGRAAHHLYGRMREDYSGDRHRAQKEAASRARLAKEMYYPVRVCTPHQLLRYALHGRGWEQMLTDLPGGCLIFDEIHSYDAALTGLTLGAARLLVQEFGCKALFASATLPNFLERLIQEVVPCVVVEPDSLLLEDREVMDRKRHNVRVSTGNVLTAVPEILEQAKSGLTVLVVCNHVKSAQQTYSALKPYLGDAVVLFHGRFNMEDRRSIEHGLSTLLLPKILVATQVVEVSLDIDFHVGYFEPAPIDALIQRMGRVNRRALPERTPATITLFSESISPHELYEKKLTDSTLNKLATIHNPLGEADLLRLCNEIYGDGYQGQQKVEFEEKLKHPFFTQFEKYLIAGRSESWVEQISADNNRIDVLPRSLIERYERLSKAGLWLDADALLVNIRFHGGLQIDRSGDPHVINAEYSSTMGLLL